MATSPKNGPAGNGLSPHATHARLFPCDSNEFTLELLQSRQEIYGPTLPEKLLFNVFERKTAALKEKVKGDTVADRAKWLARTRDNEGYMSQFSTNEKGGPQILECHSPIMNLLEQYPDHRATRTGYVEAVLGTKCAAKKLAPPVYTSAHFISQLERAAKRHLDEIFNFRIRRISGSNEGHALGPFRQR